MATQQVTLYSVPSNNISILSTEANKRINRSVLDWQILIDWIINTHGQLIPPPAPPSASSDLALVGTCVDLILNYIQSHKAINGSEAWARFLQGDFNFSPPSPKVSTAPPAKSLSFSSLFYSPANRALLAKEVDVAFDVARDDALEWRRFLSSFGRINEKLGIANREAAKVFKEIAGKLLTLQDHIPLTSSRKTIKVIESMHTQHSRFSLYILNSVNDETVVSLQASQIALNALEYRRGVLSEYEDACQATQKKLTSLETLRAARTIKPETVDAALEEMTAVKRVEGEMRVKFREVSEELRTELRGYGERRDVGFQRVLDGYVEKQIEGAEFLIRILEKHAVLP